MTWEQKLATGVVLLYYTLAIVAALLALYIGASTLSSALF